MENIPAEIIRPIGLLNRILQEPELVAQVQNLEARTLGRVIRHIGLEDAGEIIALATTEQLRQVFEEDLWRSERPGDAETFDAERFGLWLEVMLNADPKSAARKLAEMDREFVVLALTRYILVLDLNEMKYRFLADDAGEDDRVDKVLESSLNHEFDPYWVVAKDDRHWEAVLALLTELDGTHFEFLRQVLERCRRISSGLIEGNGGLYHVLTAGEQLESDAADEREQRRERQGYVAPLSAAHFLHLARRADPDELLRSAAPDPITRAYFAAYAESQASHPVSTVTPVPPQPAAGDAWVRLLQSAHVQPPSCPALPGGVADESQWPIRRALARLAEQDAKLHARRLLELNYLANTLVAGCPHENRRFRPAEAVQAAVATCNLGLEFFAEDASDSEGLARLLREHDLVQLFRFGWSRLNREVTLPVAFALQAALAGLPRRTLKLPRKLRADLEHIADICAALEKAIAAGTPWTAADQLVILEILLDTSEVYALQTFLAECPTIPDALEFSGRWRPHCKSEFIHSREQIQIARAFADSLEAKFR